MSVYPPLIVITGQTATGKSEISFEIAERNSAIIVNGDSMQVYRYMDIGTDKPSLEERERVPHEMIDILDPDEEFSAATYSEIARERIDKWIGMGKRVLIVGGTGLYIRALLFGVCSAPGPSPLIRERLKEMEKREKGILYHYLEMVDPETADKISANDLFRIIRALEVYEMTGIPISSYRRSHGFRSPLFEHRVFIFTCPTEELKKRIEKRVERMIGNRFLDEVENLLEKGYSEDMNSMKSIGYREMVSYIKGDLSFEEAVEVIKKRTKEYARRQVIWWRKEAGRMKESRWIRINEFQDRKSLIDEIERVWY